MTMFVKIVEVPGAVTEVALESGATVSDALEAGDLIVAPNQSVTVNGSPASNDTELTDGARVIVSKEAKSA